MHTVVLVDDHLLVRAGIKRLLDDAPGIRVAGEAAGADGALDLMRRHRPDVIVLNVSRPGIGALETLRRLLRAEPRPRVIILSIVLDRFFLARMLKSGAAGCLTGTCGALELGQAIDAVCRGECYLAPDIARDLAVDALTEQQCSPFDTLSARELQVLMLVTEGKKTHDISDVLCLSPKTVSTYRARMFTKLGVRSDVELTRLAIHHGLIAGATYH